MDQSIDHGQTPLPLKKWSFSRLKVCWQLRRHMYTNILCWYNAITTLGSSHALKNDKQSICCPCFDIDFQPFNAVVSQKSNNMFFSQAFHFRSFKAQERCVKLIHQCKLKLLCQFSLSTLYYRLLDCLVSTKYSSIFKEPPRRHCVGPVTPPMQNSGLDINTINLCFLEVCKNSGKGLQ